MKKNLIFLFAFALCSEIASSTIVPVVSSGYTFSPQTITVTTGDTVNFSLLSIHNVAEVSQATYAANGNTPLSGGFSTPYGGGDVFTSQLSIGTHWYVCQPHASMGMKGRIIVQSPTGIVENLLQASFSVYPNPVTSTVTLSFNKEIHGTLQLANILGKVLEQLPVNATSLTLDMGDRPRGIYFVRIEDAAGNSAMKRVVKM